MPNTTISYRDTRDIPLKAIQELYISNDWSAAKKPIALRNGLLNSHSLWTAWDRERLIGLGNAISDGHLVVYYPHLLVHPTYQRRGIGVALMKRLMAPYAGFHQQVLVADGAAISFYNKLGFTRAGKTQSMWIYAGGDH